MKELLVILSCTWKFALTFPMAIYGFDMGFLDVIVYTNIGGLLGLLFFTFLSNIILRFWQIHVQPRFVKNFEEKKAVFSSRRRKFIKIKNRYGFVGIVVFNPVFISIPISAFLVNRYYKRIRFGLLWVFLGQFIWSVIYAYFYIFIKKVV